MEKIEAKCDKVQLTLCMQQRSMIERSDNHRILNQADLPSPNHSGALLCELRNRAARCCLNVI